MSSEPSQASSNPNSQDPAWKYHHLANPRDKGHLTCNFCGHLSKGGAYRAKQHLAHVGKNVKKCNKVPADVKAEILAFMQKKGEQKSACDWEDDFDDGDYGMEDADLEMEDARAHQRGKRPLGSSSGSTKQLHKKGRSNPRGTIDSFYSPKPATLQQGDRRRQTTMNEHGKGQDLLREEACQKIARFWYDAGIPFNLVRLPSFTPMIHAIGKYGRNMKPPSYHEIRVKYLKKEMDFTSDMLKDHKESWARFGCSVMCDGWKDRAGRHLLNFLVNGRLGSIFIESIDSSAYVEDGLRMFELIQSFIDREVGPSNVVQVVTDNASAMKKAGKHF